ncbi:sugar ABC transporter ATP-binding protein [Thermosediminibacter oceani]|uniref:Monosaccharide ABC transporter ATP-binding protein, CUT2 family n=1 Tax=Thermosediminibacter oceani (strain ATCC BAA-1034 / DSM 16646 / JW/IW-1228P) TaxID=555079 RepID=D9RZ49_THEOJ|nr:sugar ABC transporter ATP-binding protein [Thermosediminibacter oceani]ADL08603.1 monosaccharide ABC transporter ATP-binding protein, CUT2 family [Thermosediminibacter oceani DSM 16646]
MENLLLKAENISKQFSGVKALQNVSFELRKGEVHALLGENGAGKSTFVKILAGIHKKDEGTIYIDGKPVTIDNPKAAQEHKISIIHQELNLCPHLTVAQNIFLGREYMINGVINEKRQNEEAKKILKKFNLDIDPATKVKNLPVSKQQMVEIAKAISTDARILIMDEPTSALTENEIEELFSMIKKLKENGCGIIYISHRLEELKEIADRVTVFRDGKYIKTLDFKDTRLDELISLMVGREINEKFPRVEVPRGEKIFEVRNISRGNILKNISFELYEGEILGFAGLMGSGRTELMRAIFGADKRDSGEIYLHGKKLNINSPADAIKNGIVYVPEDRKHDGLALNMCVSHNITMASVESICNKIGVLNTKKEISVSNKIVSDLKIKTPSLFQRVRNLSGGNQQKIVVGKWILKNPALYIFDEPTRGIDVGAKIEIYNILNQLKQKGIGVIIVSSELPELLGISDRIYVMCEGEIKANLITRRTTQKEIMYYATLYKNERKVVL